MHIQPRARVPAPPAPPCYLGSPTVCEHHHTWPNRSWHTSIRGRLTSKKKRHASRGTGLGHPRKQDAGRSANPPQATNQFQISQPTSSALEAPPSPVCVGSFPAEDAQKQKKNDETSHTKKQPSTFSPRRRTRRSNTNSNQHTTHTNTKV